MNKPRVSPSHALIGRGVTHVLPLIPPRTCHGHVTKLTLPLPIPDEPLATVPRHEHDPHLVLHVRVRQMDLLRPTTRPKPELRRAGEQVLRARKWVLVVVPLLGVDLRLGPSKDPERLDRRLTRGIETLPDPDCHDGDEERKTYPTKLWWSELGGEYIPSQSSLEGLSIPDHWIRTESPDLERVVVLREIET
ncbi:LOW QUALITY PROTEIN: hypothetical protein TorRG33x02_308670 [Trema orientale]|uniref:Uncharacterized protein n=1 Tax=Trema orientale TaxID=63057 RepID=A0A2P5BU76_TREOI|nr:LOW QUALITY PROTEIN: hypothetical protein TorRG33x02_308670 [Trema orientale]